MSRNDRIITTLRQLLATYAENREDFGAFKRIVVAGGAVRDFALGLPIRDIDILYERDEGYIGDDETIHADLRDLFATAVKVDADFNEYGLLSGDATRMQFGRSKKEIDGETIEISFMEVASIKEDIEYEFPDDISQFWMDPDGIVRFTEAAAVARSTNTITFKNDGKDYSVRASKLAAKFGPAWTVRQEVDVAFPAADQFGVEPGPGYRYYQEGVPGCSFGLSVDGDVQSV